MTEAGHVQDLLTRLALSHPEVAIRFVNNGQEKLRTSGSGKLKEVIYSIYGRETAANILELDYEKNGIGIRGFIGKPIILSLIHIWSSDPKCRAVFIEMICGSAFNGRSLFISMIRFPLDRFQRRKPEKDPSVLT